MVNMAQSFVISEQRSLDLEQLRRYQTLFSSFTSMFVPALSGLIAHGYGTAERPRMEGCDGDKRSVMTRTSISQVYRARKLSSHSPGLLTEDSSTFRS